MPEPSTTDTRRRSRAGPPPPVKPPHLKRLSFPRPASHVGSVAGSFDSAHQTSTAFLESAWESRPVSSASTVREDAGRSRSPSEGPSWDEVDGQEAWALWAFEGTEPSELSSVAQHAPVRVLSLEHSDGWSLVRLSQTGEIGLMPRSYYSFDGPARWSPPTSAMLPRTTDIDAPLIRPSPPVHSPAASPPPVSPIAAQMTGTEGTLSKMVRQSLFHGWTLNRFSSFVVGGAESWIIDGPPDQDTGSSTPSTAGHARLRSTDSDLSASDYRVEARARGISEADLHFIDFGPAWKAKTPLFEISVHDPQKRKSLVGLSDYTIYLITSVFPSGDVAEETVSEVTVERRFSNFVSLAQHLAKKFSGLALQPLPEKGLTGRFAADFVETRRGDLERWLRRIARHPVVRYSDALVTFLGAEDEEEWTRMCPTLDEDAHMGPLFYANIFHPSFNFDLEDAQETIERFENHVVAADKGTQGLRETVAKLREGQKDHGNVRRLFALHLFALVRSRQVGGSADAGASGPERDEPERVEQKGLLTADGGWCFLDNCESCLQVTKAIEFAAERLAEVADLEVQHADTTLLKTQEALKDVAHPSKLYAPVIETHRTTVARYVDLLAEAEAPSDDSRTWIAAPLDAAARCETVLNSTLAEMNEYHDAKAVDFRNLTSAYFDAEIAFHEAVLVKLKAARAAFEPSAEADQALGGSRRPSSLEAQLASPSQSMKTELLQPSPHPLDSLVRPMTAAATVLNDSVSRVWSSLPTPGGKRLSRWLW